MKMTKIWARILVAVMLILSVTALVSCGGDDSDVSGAKSAPVEGYVGSFYTAFKNMFEDELVEEYTEEGIKVDSNISVKNGWSGQGAPDKSELANGQKPVTFIAKLDANFEGERMTMEMKFFMAYDASENVLIPVAGYSVESAFGETDSYTPDYDELIEAIEDIYED